MLDVSVEMIGKVFGRHLCSVDGMTTLRMGCVFRTDHTDVWQASRTRGQHMCRPRGATYVCVRLFIHAFDINWEQMCAAKVWRICGARSVDLDVGRIS